MRRLAVVLLVTVACVADSPPEPLTERELEHQSSFLQAFVTSHTCLDLMGDRDRFDCTRTMSPALFGGLGIPVTYEVGPYDASVDPDRGPNDEEGDALFGNLARPLVEERIIELYEWHLGGWPERTSEWCDPSLPRSEGAPVWEPGFAATAGCGRWLASGIDQFIAEGH